MDQVMIGSAAAKLELTRLDGRGQVSSTIRVRITGPGLSAAVDIYDYDTHEGLARFFEYMAHDWRGWVGARAYTTLEGEFEIEATHTGSHVELHLRLRSSVDGGWSVDSVVVIDAGEDLAASARGVRTLTD